MTHWPLSLGELFWILGKSGKIPKSSGLIRESITHWSLPVSTDEGSMNKVTEKTHRVLRVIGEVNGEGTT